MVPRLLIRIALFLAAYCVFALPLFAQQQPGRSDEVVKVNTELVQTDFMVFDKQGNFIDGLKNNQFVLKVEGKPREITFFDRIAAGSRSEEAQLAAARGTSNDGSKSKPVPLDRGRTVMFFLDDYHMSPASMSQIRATLKRFVEREMRQNDFAAIATASGQLGFLQQLTDNKEVMMTAVDRLKVQQLTIHTAEQPPMTEYQALSVEQRDPDVIGYFVDWIIKENPQIPRQTAAEMVNQRASQILEDSSSITTRSLLALRSFVNNTSALAGRKVVFFISDGFFIDRNHSDNQDRLQRITAAAARSGTVIYSLDARGLTSGLPDASTAVAADPSGRLTRANIGELRATQDGMNALAADTGGRAFFNTNSFSTAVSKALKDSSVYYLIAWRPDSEEQRNPKFRRIELSVLDRPDLVVRFRRGFGEPPPAEETKKSKDKNPAPPARKTPLEELNATLRSAFPLPELPVAISLAFLDTAQYGSTLTTSIKIDTYGLGTERDGDTTTALLDVAGIVLNDQGRSVSSFSKRVTVKASLKGTVITLPDNFFYNHFSLLKPGIYQVRVAAVDARRGTRGSAHQWITIPDLASRDLSMSSLIVGERMAASEIEPANSTSSEPQPPAALRQVVVNVDHRFARSSFLRFLTFIYNAQLGSTTATPPVPPAGGNINTSAVKTALPDLAVQVQIFRDNEPVVTTPLHKINTEGIDAQRVPYAAEVRLDDLQPGAYVLQVTVIDRMGKSSASQKLNFQIE